MTDKIKLTKAAIEKLETPSSGRIFVYDSSITGLCICLTSANTRTWYLYKKVNGKPVRLKLGRFPEVSPEAAKTLAMEAAGRMAGGEDIQAARAAKRQKEMTWGELFEKYMAEHAKIHKKTWREDEGNNTRNLKDWAERPLSSFSRPVIADKHRQIGATGATTTANRILSLVSKVFSFADEAGLWDKKNPCKGIKKFKENERDRFVQPGEMPVLLRQIRAYPNATLRDYFLICLLTGARRANVFSMKWVDVDLTAGVWRIPETKSGQAVRIALAPEAQTILCDRMKICGESSEYVFPGRYGKSHLKEPKKAWAKILENSGLKDLKIHDLRRTLGSWQAAAGVSLITIGKSLGHRTTTATAIYARMNLDPVRESVSAAVTAMMTAGKKGPKAAKKAAKKQAKKSDKKPQDPGGKTDENQSAK
jgi:integrase